jgi:purine catabolism regulator
VFEVPYEVPFIALTEAAFTKLVNEQYGVLRRAIAAHGRLERIVLSERGLDALAATLSTLIGAAVLVFDGRGEPLVRRAFRRAVEPETIEALHASLCERARQGEPREFLPPAGEHADRALALEVPADGAGDAGRLPEAWLVAVKDGGPLNDFDRLTLHQAVTIVALELLRGRVAVDTERRLAGDVLAAIVNGELAGPELTGRLEAFGLSDRVAALVVQPPSNGRGSPAFVEDALATGLREEAAHGLVASVGTLACALVAGSPRQSCSSSPNGSRSASSAWELACASASGARWTATVPGGASTKDAARWRRWHWGLWPSKTARAAPPAWPPIATSGPSSCCCRCRTMIH